MRCHEAVTKLPCSYDIVINIQGDEPLMEPEIIDGVVRALQDTPDCNYRCGWQPSLVCVTCAPLAARVPSRRAGWDRKHPKCRSK